MFPSFIVVLVKPQIERLSVVVLKLNSLYFTKLVYE